MKLAVVRVRGLVKMPTKMEDTLRMLRLYEKNYCIVIEDTPQNRGMVKKVEHFVTYGTISEDVLRELVGKRGEDYVGQDMKRKYFEYNGKRHKKYFRLHPPRKGYGRKGIKMMFNKAGALGERGEKINDLLRRMI